MYAMLGSCFVTLCQYYSKMAIFGQPKEEPLAGISIVILEYYSFGVQILQHWQWRI